MARKQGFSQSEIDGWTKLDWRVFEDNILRDRLELLELILPIIDDLKPWLNESLYSKLKTTNPKALRTHIPQNRKEIEEKIQKDQLSNNVLDAILNGDL